MVQPLPFFPFCVYSTHDEAEHHGGAAGQTWPPKLPPEKKLKKI